jgi:gamma-glutamyltranspeptidase/glutathione hydrolase
MRSLKLLAGLLLLAGCATTQAPAGTPIAVQTPAHSTPLGTGPSASLGTGPSVSLGTGMVSAADPRAAEAGVRMLRLGGSATDAALATMFALTVVEPQSSGIGGGGFYVEGDAAGHVETINGREKAPAAARPDWFLVDGQPRAFSDAQPGGLSTGVPGNVLLAARAHAAHGKLPWAKLFQPAIELAEQGFVITPRLHKALAGQSATGAFGAGATIFYDASGNALAAGTRVRNRALGAFLRRLAAEGSKAFYEGQNAAALAAAVSTAKHNPAPMTVADVTGMTAPSAPPVCGEYRHYRICGMGPPSSGATTVFTILKQLERFDLTALGKDNPVAWHLIAESMRLAYADREKYLADTDFISVPVAGLTDPAYLASRSALIDPARSLPHAVAGTPPGAPATRFAPAAPQPEHGTSHFVAVDRAGNVVSYTSTIESSFGSGLVVNGYYLNNELTDFAFDPVAKDGAPVANRVEGGKRPRSSMAPTIVYAPDGHVRLALGAAGGSTIPAQVAKAIIGVIDFQLSAQAAIALPIIYAPSDTVRVESGTFLEAMAPRLRALGHEVAPIPPGTFKANAIEWTQGRWSGAADPRSEGVAVSE